MQLYLIQQKMEQLLESYRNGTEYIIPRLVKFHIEFDEIHPFIDVDVIIGTRLKNPVKLTGLNSLVPIFYFRKKERDHRISGLRFEVPHILLTSDRKV